MSTGRPIIVWFRQDLRIADNPALSEAARSGRPVILLYILDETPGLRPIGAASRAWLERSLKSLAAGLTSLGGELVIRKGPAGEVLAAVIVETGADGVFWNRLYDSASTIRDAAIKSDLAAAGIECRSFNAALLNEPWEVRSALGDPYRVFSAYWRAARARIEVRPPSALPERLPAAGSRPVSEGFDAWPPSPTTPDWSRGFERWAPGEPGARDALERFLSGGVRGYAQARDRPALDGTSGLSPHLHFGEIGPRQVWRAAYAAIERGQAPEGDVETFLKELGWREFNHHLLFHHPEISGENFNANFDAFPWRRDPAALDAWRRGATGYPLVDAGMRELRGAGWMHNRVRMIVASFLTKDLMIDWRAGEAWFWDTLVDADLANNVANWQWVAGSGADAAPYFRIFNPVLQSETFDTEGEYVRRWVPELSRLPAPWVHQPWRAGAERLRAAGIVLGVDYPAPIIDHKVARLRALEAYRSLSARSHKDPEVCYDNDDAA